MAEDTKIAEHVFNPWREKNGTRVVASEAMWRGPLRWNKAAGDCEAFLPGQGRPRVFCASLADVFEDWTGPMVNSQGNVLFPSNSREWRDMGRVDQAGITMQDVRAILFRLIGATPNLDWLILSKRPENMLRMMGPEGVGLYAHANGPVPCPQPNLWLGTSIENQAAADERIPHLLRVPAAVRFLSVEPLLGPVSLSHHMNSKRGFFADVKEVESCGKVYPKRSDIDWVIVGGESGPGARPCDVAWIRSVVEQCKAAGVPCFVKQLGSKPGGRTPSLSGPLGDPTVHDHDHILRIRDPKGGDPGEWPADLRVREYPTVNGGGR